MERLDRLATDRTSKEREIIVNFMKFKEAYNLLYASYNKDPIPEYVELLYKEHFHTFDAERFYRACKNASDVCNKFPCVEELKREYRNLRPNYEVEKDVKRGVRMPQGMRDLIDKIKDKQKESL